MLTFDCCERGALSSLASQPIMSSVSCPLSLLIMTPASCPHVVLGCGGRVDVVMAMTEMQHMDQTAEKMIVASASPSALPQQPLVSIDEILALRDDISRIVRLRLCVPFRGRQLASVCWRRV